MMRNQILAVATVLAFLGTSAASTGAGGGPAPVPSVDLHWDALEVGDRLPVGLGPDGACPPPLEVVGHHPAGGDPALPLLQLVEWTYEPSGETGCALVVTQKTEAPLDVPLRGVKPGVYTGDTYTQRTRSVVTALYGSAAHSYFAHSMDSSLTWVYNRYDVAYVTHTQNCPPPASPWWLDWCYTDGPGGDGTYVQIVPHAAYDKYRNAYPGDIALDVTFYDHAITGYRGGSDCSWRINGWNAYGGVAGCST